MKGKKNLERAIVLGLLLSTSVYSNVLAEKTYTIEEFRDLGNEIPIEENTIVNGTGTSIGGDEVNNTISGKVITVSDGVNFTLNNLAGNHMDIKGNGNIFINLDHDAGANGGAIYINGNITANKLTIDTSKTPNTKGIYTYGGDVVLDVNELDIKANSHGIFTTGDATSDVIINDTDKVSITTDGAHGIVNSGNASHVNNIIIKSDRENSLVDIFSHTAGISNNNSGGGVIDIKADTISIGTDNLYAVRGDHGDIILNAKNNTISGGTSGVHTLNGDIKITAEKGNQIATTNNKDVTLGAIYTSTDKEGNPGNGTIEIIANNGNNKVNAVTDGVHTKGNGTVDLIANGYNSIISDKNAVYNNGTNTINIKAVASENESTSTLADYNDYNNILIAGENGVKSDSTGTTNVIADNNNYIAGTTNGILSDGAGTITVTAVNDNIIGQYTYKDENNSDVIVTSNTGINVTEGTVNVTAGSSNNIYGTNIGVSVSGENSKVTMTGVDNIITVNDSNELIDNTSGIYVSDGGTYQIVKNNGNNTNINVTAHVKNAYGINAEKQGFVDIDTDNLEINTYFNSTFSGGNHLRGLYVEQSNVDIDSAGIVNLYVSSTNSYDENSATHGVYVETNDTENKTYSDSIADINANSINITSISTGNSLSTSFGVEAKTVPDDGSKANVNLTTNGENGILITAQSTGTAYGLNAADNAEINITAYNGDIVIKANGGNGSVSEGIQVDSIDIASSNKDVSAKVDISAENTNVAGSYAGLHANYGKSFINLTAKSGSNTVFGGTIGVRSENGADVGITADSGSNYVTTDNGAYGIYTTNAPGGNITSNTFTNGKDAVVVLDAKNNIIDKSKYGIYGYCYTDTDLIADVQNSITANRYGIYATFDTEVTLSAGDNNYIASGDTANGFGNAYAVYAFDNGGFKGSNVLLDAVNQNYLLGAVYANGNDEQGNATTVTLDSKENVIRSYAVINNAGDLNTNEEFKDKSVVSALYAQNGANIELTGENYIGTYADNTDKDTLERTVWAYNEGTIDITGAAQIGTDRYDSSPNSADVAIAAGTATNLTKDIVDNYDETYNPRATVTVNYDDFKDEKGVSINKSNISGDILSAYAGLVDISTDNSEAGININGNLLAGNNGILSVDLGKGGTLIGRADDYGDAGYVGNIENEGDSNEHQNFYNPEFSSTIYSGGRVDLEMGAGSTWYVTGQSWITSINTEKAQGDTKDTRATIDLTTLYENDEADATTAHALTVYDFKGDADFKMNLSGDRTNSDMLYMKHADGTYRINLVDAVTTDEINSDQNGNEFSGLRFATVGSDSKVNFVVGSYDNGGAFNVEYEVGTDEYGGAETAHENDVYNGDSLNSGKPGSDMVDGFFGSDGEPVSSDNNTESGISTMDLQAANNIMLMSEEAATLDETAAAANDAADYNATNHKIIARLGEEISDTGKTILNMSRANYSNAIYMDRLNKRLGEARYINSEEDEGMWVRIRHDRIGKDDAYRSQNTMYELGYDQKQECDNGERRVGMAIDYMHGDTGYDQIAGKGEIDRYGLWLYDTWMGDKGHYADYVAKWGHLSNDFEVYTMQNGDKVTGDYSNNVFSVSAEYGRKKDIGNDWYFEPQVQAQLARVTGADYTTNQGTKVSVDGINSLIGRAGFRLGKDFGEEKQSTVYIKADVLHEFLGDQDVRVLDKSSDNKWAGISYENEGTWYDVGFGFATQMSKNSYAFMDFEKSFGNDNDETYQINVGMQWSF